MNKQKLLTGAVTLTAATVISKLLGSLFRIPLQNIAGDEVLGLFTLVYPVYMVSLLLSVAGIPLAISKLIAEANEKESIRHIYRTSGLLAAGFGILSFLLIFTFSDPISMWLGGEETKLALILVSTSLIAAPYMAVYRGYFQGFQDMNPTAVSQVLEQFFRTCIILLAAYVFTKSGYPSEMVAGLIMLGSLVGVGTSLVYLRWKYVRSPYRIQTGRTRLSFSEFRTWSVRILRLSIPIAFGSIVMASMNIIDSFTIPFRFRGEELSYVYGLYGRGLSLVQITTVFATSIILPLLPMMSELKKKDRTHEVRELTERTHYYTHLLAWPAAAGLISLAVPINITLFSNAEGSSTIAILGASSVFTSISIIGTAILQGLDRSTTALWIVGIALIVKAAGNLLLVPSYGIEGAGLATLGAYILSVVLNTILIFRAVRFSVITVPILKGILASLIMGIVLTGMMLFFEISFWNRFGVAFFTLFSCVLGAGIYILLLLFMKAVDRTMLERIPVLNKFLS